jgi:CrcB protein
MIKSATLIGIGGAVGSILRYFFSKLIQTNVSTIFPLGTLAVNVSGCFLIGVIFGLSERYNVAPEWRLLLATGLCGGYTTFSTYSNESVAMLREGQWWYFTMYVASSVILGILATLTSIFLMEKI